MFGSSKVQALEAKIRELDRNLEQAAKEKTDLEQQLAAAKRRAAELEAQLADTDLEQLKEEVRSSKAEFEGLKELYAKKIQAFDNTKEEKEQEFARQAAIERYNLDNEIRDNRQANQEYVRKTVQTFGESYNYYLSQIKLLMDALGDVASRTGEALFAEPTEDLKAKFGEQMVDKLRIDTGTLRSDDGDKLLIGSTEEAKHEEEPTEEEAAPAPEIVEAEAALGNAEYTVEAATETVEEAAPVVEEVAAEAEDAVEAVAEEVKNFFDAPAEGEVEKAEEE